MGEFVKCQKTAVAQASDEFVAVQTMGTRMHVRWDETAQATEHRQIVYFAEFWPLLVFLRVGYRPARCATAVPTYRACATCWVL